VDDGVGEKASWKGMFFIFMSLENTFRWQNNPRIRQGWSELLGGEEDRGLWL
jgi:hypothetical protein